MGDEILVAVRLGLYLSLGLLAGLPLYCGLLEPRQNRLSRLGIAALAMIAGGLSGVWLLVTTAAMAGVPLGQPDGAAIQMILNDTAMGAALVWRWVALLVLVVLPPRPWLLVAPAAMALATLAWTGHAVASEGLLGWAHLAADIIHMLAAALWLGALARFLSGLFCPASGRGLADALARFARVGSIVVGLLVVTGSINLVMITGVDQIVALPGTIYGRLLLVKLSLFALILGLAAANRWWLTPSLAFDPQGATRRLRWSLVIETLGWVGVALAVAWLGTLDPLA